MTRLPWTSLLKYDPLPTFPPTIPSHVLFFVQRDLLESEETKIESLWTLPGAVKILNKQNPDGSWPDKTPKKHVGSPTNYALLETYRNLGVLAEMYGLNNTHPGIQKAAEFIFNTQTTEGDFRGIYGTQYSPNYSGAILEILVKLGYVEDSRVKKSFEWLLKIQQQGGGWTLPMQTHKIPSNDFDKVASSSEVFPFEPEKIYAHLITGIVIRAFAAHPMYCNHPDAQKAGNLLASRFFLKDKYTSHQSEASWKKYSFPFWWTDLISSIDSLVKMGFSLTNKRMSMAFNYFKADQKPEGQWDFYILKNKSQPDLNLWLNLLMCRITKKLYDNSKE